MIAPTEIKSPATINNLIINQLASIKENDQENIELKFGELTIKLNSDGYFMLSNQQATITLQCDGKITINGNEIVQHSKNDLTLNADHHIHLNNPKIEQ